jgi:NADH pyrophosphatase NudC (nudix superfamily)
MVGPSRAIAADGTTSESLTGMNQQFKFCPRCATPLQRAIHGGMERLGCGGAGCGYVLWDNPTPVVAAVVEHQGKIVLARNKAWPENIFALITGFLERNENPEQAVLREVEEELGVKARDASFIGHYGFERMNQLIIAYHVIAEGEIALGEELAEYKHVAFEKARYWPAATGLALRDWLLSRGFNPQAIELPSPRRS